MYTMHIFNSNDSVHMSHVYSLILNSQSVQDVIPISSYSPIINALGSNFSGRKPCSLKNLYFGDMSVSFPSISETTLTDVV